MKSTKPCFVIDSMYRYKIILTYFYMTEGTGVSSIFIKLFFFMLRERTSLDFSSGRTTSFMCFGSSIRINNRINLIRSATFDCVCMYSYLKRTFDITSHICLGTWGRGLNSETLLGK